MSKPAVTVDLRRGRVYIFPTYSPGPGTYIDKPPVRESTPDCPEAIGRYVLDALGEFVVGGTMPDRGEPNPALLADLGFSSWSEYARGIKDCLVTQEEQELLIRGERGPLRVPVICSDETLGRAVLQAVGAAKRYWQARD